MIKQYLREVMRRDEDSTELRSDILRKNALIADLTAMNQRNRAQNGHNGHVSEQDIQVQNPSSNAPTDGAVELELAQTKVLTQVVFRKSMEFFLVRYFNRNFNSDCNSKNL